MSKRRERLIVACGVAISLVCIAFTLALQWTAQTLYVSDPQLASTPGVRILDPNFGLFEIVRSEPNKPAVRWTKVDIHLPDVCRLQQCGRASVKVMGRVNDAEEYRIVLDTGCWHQALVTDTVVRGSNLEIHPFSGLGPNAGGFCHLCRLKIGQLTVVHPQTTYLLGHYERKVLGRTVWTEKEILLGLAVLRHLSYLLVDGVQKEVVLAGRAAFVPDDPNHWCRYPLTIGRSSPEGQEMLMVSMSLAGQAQSLMFDTGADPGLIVSKNRWDTLAEKLHPVSRRHARIARPFGWEECDVVTVRDLEIGGMCLPQTQVHISASENDRLKLGMGFFTQTMLVLDFKNGLLWIRQADAAPPPESARHP